MISDEEFQLHNERRDKEFVYEQWRKFLALRITDEDINRTERSPIKTTTEQLRAVFNNGYKLAMMQVLMQLKQKNRFISEESTAIIDGLIEDVEDRLVTSDCLASYRHRKEDCYFEAAQKRKAEFDFISNKDFCNW